MELAYSNRGKFAIRTTANIIHKRSSNAHVLFLEHLLDVLVGKESSMLLADSENVSKNLINRLTLDRIENDLFTALDLDTAEVYQTSSLDFDTLLYRDHSKAQNYPWPAVYLHVVYHEKHHRVFWLDVGTAMDVEIKLLNIASSGIPPADTVYIITYWICPADKISSSFSLVAPRA
jgi:hypothetical protein